MPHTFRMAPKGFLGDVLATHMTSLNNHNSIIISSTQNKRVIMVLQIPEGADKAKIKVRINMDLHGLVKVDSAHAVVEKEVEEPAAAAAAPAGNGVNATAAPAPGDAAGPATAPAPGEPQATAAGNGEAPAPMEAETAAPAGGAMCCMV